MIIRTLDGSPWGYLACQLLRELQAKGTPARMWLPGGYSAVSFARVHIQLARRLVLTVACRAGVRSGMSVVGDPGQKNG